jgi:hypothetical protein
MVRAWLCAALACVVAAGCTTTEAEKQAAETLRQDADAAGSFRICDCLLPAPIRKIGAQMVVLGPRRAVKTSTRDCEIRGGEYVAYDRADYATALRYWLAQAQGGDPVAQTYVGEIFEKGPGGRPDYAAAAEWYRRAAEKGYARAGLNLGALYERGLGVPRDPKQALEWYRRASGLPGLTFELPGRAAVELHALRRRTSELETQLKERQAEADSLRRRLADARAAPGGDSRDRERKELEDRLARVEAGLASSRTAYARESKELRAIIERQRKELESARVRPGGNGGIGPPGVSPPPDVPYGTYHGLVIGVGEYRHLPPVNTAVRDAEDIAQVLRNEYGFKVRLRSNPRGDEIKAEMVALRERLRREDNLLIYYAGRCELEGEGQSGYWLPFDAQGGRSETWISTDEVTRNLERMQASQIIVIADSCYEPKGAPAAVPHLVISGDRLAETLGKMARQRSRIVLTSGGLQPEPASTGRPHSAFAEAFLQVLQQNTGVLLGEQLFRQLQIRMPVTLTGPSGAEGPGYAPIKFAHEGGDFIFVRTGLKAAAAWPPEAAHSTELN